MGETEAGAEKLAVYPRPEADTPRVAEFRRLVARYRITNAMFRGGIGGAAIQFMTASWAYVVLVLIPSTIGHPLDGQDVLRYSVILLVFVLELLIGLVLSISSTLKWSAMAEVDRSWTIKRLLLSWLLPVVGIPIAIKEQSKNVNELRSQGVSLDHWTISQKIVDSHVARIQEEDEAAGFDMSKPPTLR